MTKPGRPDCRLGQRAAMILPELLDSLADFGRWLADEQAQQNKNPMTATLGGETVTGPVRQDLEGPHHEKA
jgi:hypothetical protein